MASKTAIENKTGAERQQQRNLQRPQRTEGLSRRDPFDPSGWTPFAMMRRMQEDMDRLFGGFGLGRFGSPFGSEQSEWAPAVEAFQRGNEFVVRADVPGLSREDLSVEVGDEALTIRGERKFDHEEEREGIFRSERSYGAFCRVIPLPEGVLADSAKANFKSGVLEVVMQAPPHEVRRGRQLEISEGERQAQPASRKEEANR